VDRREAYRRSYSSIAWRADQDASISHQQPGEQSDRSRRRSDSTDACESKTRPGSLEHLPLAAIDPDGPESPVWTQG
jgi:hypothetical protein